MRQKTRSGKAPTHELLCPGCKMWASYFGQTSLKDKDGDWHRLCCWCCAPDSQAEEPVGVEGPHPPAAPGIDPTTGRAWTRGVGPTNPGDELEVSERGRA